MATFEGFVADGRVAGIGVTIKAVEVNGLLSSARAQIQQVGDPSYFRGSVVALEPGENTWTAHCVGVFGTEFMKDGRLQRSFVPAVAEVIAGPEGIMLKVLRSGARQTADTSSAVEIYSIPAMSPIPAPGYLLYFG